MDFSFSMKMVQNSPLISLANTTPLILALKTVPFATISGEQAGGQGM